MKPWAEVQTQGKPIIIGAFYRQPSAKECSLKDMVCSMQSIKNKQGKHIVLGGDFSLPHINWKRKSIKAGSNHHIQYQQLLDMAQEFGFEQMQLSPSREGNILDLYLTTYSSLVKSCYTVPDISDHHMVVVDFDVKPRYRRKKTENYISAKRQTEPISNLRALSMYIAHSPSSVEAKWQDLRDGIFKAMLHDMPTKLSSNRSHLPWLSSKLNKCIKKKHK